MSHNGKVDHMSVRAALEKLNETEMEDITIDGVKGLFPGMQQGPLFSASSDSGNPGLKIIDNDGDLLGNLKILYIEDISMANKFSGAISECFMFLENEDGSPNTEVLMRLETIKNRLALYCSVGGRWVDTYKQTVTGVLTNTMSDKGGWERLALPLGGKEDQHRNRSTQKPPGKGKP